MIRTTLALIVVAVLSGCSLISSQVSSKVAKAVEEYCEQPIELRLANRQLVNAMIAPNHVQIDCIQDQMSTPQ